MIPPRLAPPFTLRAWRQASALLALASLCLAPAPGCGRDDPADDRAPDDTAPPTDGRVPDDAADDDDTAEPDTAAPDDDAWTPIGVEGADLIRRFAGLWRGAAVDTPLGGFSRVIMDMRPADAHVLFGRVDLDAANSLRFAFSVETHGAQDTLVFRNGGQFAGLDRDTRTILVEHDAAQSTWRFCALDGGCAYVDALWRLEDDDTRARLDVVVRGLIHVGWTASRVEARPVASDFPAAGSAGTGDVPFPPLGSLEVTVRWDEPVVDDEAWVWIVLSTTPCGFTATGCEASRSLGARLSTGATEATLHIEQLHHGDYRLNAVLDRDGDFATRQLPGSGDGVAAPDLAVSLAPGDEAATASTSIVATRP